MRYSRLVILTAILLEAKAIASALGMPIPAPKRMSRRTIDGLDVELHVVGISGQGLADLPVPDGSARVIMAGLAGALDPTLNVGDVVIDGLPSEIPLPLSARRGLMYCATEIAANPQQKASLFAQTGAIAVEMENDTVRHWLGLESGAVAPSVAIRAISDRADQSIDPCLLRLVDQFGRARIGSILWTLLRRPTLIPGLVRLGANSKVAAVKLGEVVREMVVQLAKTTPRKQGG